jgi:lipopolysaccharide/colanic/teichoic acid biosynthesis glycosyltransferase
MKRVLDCLVAGGAAILLSPVMLMVAWLIRREDGGPVMYRAPRVGRGGKSFKMLKFRTMVVNADKIGGSSTSDEDPRLTRIGRRLRRNKLDELPQLFNVINGDMSLVGPRPEVQEYVDLYTPEEMAILQVRPGITDWASLWNSDEGAILARYADPDAAYRDLIRPTKVRLQLEYVRRRSLSVDLNILAKTLLRIVGLDHSAYVALPIESAYTQGTDPA